MFAAVFDGASFTAPAPLHPAGVEPWSTTWAGGDVDAVGNDLAAVYSTGGNGVGPIYCVRSSDGGFTWSDTVRVAPFPGLEARFPTVAMVPLQGPVVQYMEFDPGWANARYVTARSLDGGQSFEPPVPVSAQHAPGEVCDCCTGQILADANTVVGLFRNAGSNIRTIWGAASVDDGASFPIGGELDDTGWSFNACPSSGPDAYVTGDTLRYVWMSGAVNGTKIHAASAALSDMGAMASMNVHGGQPVNLQQNFPRIAGNGDTLGIVWQQTSVGQVEILFSWSVTGLAGLSVPDTVNASLAGLQKNPDLVFASGMFHIVWEDHPSGTVRYRSATLTDDSAIDGVEGSPLLLWPSPVSDVLHVGSAPPGTKRIALIDGSGRIALDLQFRATIDISSLATGPYQLVLRDAGNSVVASGRVAVAR